MAILEQDRFESWFRETGSACLTEEDLCEKLTGSFGEELLDEYHYDNAETQALWDAWKAALRYEFHDSKMTLSDQSIIEYQKSIGANFGNTSPVRVVQEGLLKAACGWHNGSTCDSILQHHGLITRSHNEEVKLTRKGEIYLWEALGDLLDENL